MKLTVSRIQRMCFDDGPGIRTTVFLQGCNLHCPWCSNPETQSIRGSEGWIPAPRDYTPDELTEELLKDRVFWGDEGGVTFSGGEPLLQSEGLRAAGEILKEEGVGTAVETALCVPMENLKTVTDVIDFWYVDLKILVKDLAASVLGADPDMYLKNLEYLADKGSDVHLRIPCCEEYVLQEENREKILKLCAGHSHFPVELFAIHSLGAEKYKKLGRTVPEFKKTETEMLIELKKELESNGSEVTILEI